MGNPSLLETLRLGVESVPAEGIYHGKKIPLSYYSLSLAFLPVLLCEIQEVVNEDHSLCRHH